MLRLVLNAWVTKTTAAGISANPATRRRQVSMTISLNPLRCPGKPTRFPGTQKPSLRIPTKPAGHSNRKPATDSDLKPAGVPI